MFIVLQVQKKILVKKTFLSMIRINSKYNTQLNNSKVATENQGKTVSINRHCNHIFRRQKQRANENQIGLEKNVCCQSHSSTRINMFCDRDSDRILHRDTWEKISKQLNASALTPRTMEEIEKKWNNILSTSKGEISTFRKQRAITGKLNKIFHIFTSPFPLSWKNL